MIEIQAQRGESGQLWQITVRGHAELAAAGNDILCAAVSVLMESLEQALDLLLGVVNQGDKKKGYHCIELNESDQGRESSLLMAATLLGLQALAVQYPDRIRLKEIESSQ